jgi:hypothetical protein
VSNPSSYKIVTGGSFAGLKRPGHEADHSLPFSAEVKNGGSVLPLHVWSSRGTTHETRIQKHLEVSGSAVHGSNVLQFTWRDLGQPRRIYIPGSLRPVRDSNPGLHD